MKVPSWLKRLTLVEIVVAVIFILYIVLPLSTPATLVPFFKSPISLIVICMIVLYLFLYSNPVLAVLYLGVAYMLLRRSSSLPVLGKSNKPPTLPVIPIPKNSRMKTSSSSGDSQKLPENVDVAMVQPAMQQQRTLEEDVVSEMAPVGQTSVLVNTTFLPVASNINGASVTN